MVLAVIESRALEDCGSRYIISLIYMYWLWSVIKFTYLKYFCATFPMLEQMPNAAYNSSPKQTTEYNTNKIMEGQNNQLEEDNCV